MKLLIAEDELISCKALEKTISDWGYDVIAVKNGEEAWQILRNYEIRLAIIDWMMPGIDGIQLCKKIRQESREKKSKYTYIILLTGNNRQEDIIKGLSAGADDFMHKPVNFLELKVRLQNGERIIAVEDSRIKLAYFDSLTNLWNRNKIFEFFEEELERGFRHDLSTGVLMVDIDHFKEVNDSYGHFIGDIVICEVAARLNDSIRRYDKIGRYGGDEMFVVLPDCRQAHVMKIGERMRKLICEKKIETEAGLLDITISLGGASSEIFPHASVDKLIQASDRALYLAKNQGRNRVFLAESPHLPIISTQ